MKTLLSHLQGPEDKNLALKLLEIIHGENFSSFVFVPAYSHWTPLKSLTENLGQHIAWGHLNFKSAAIFPASSKWEGKGLCLQRVSWSWKLAQETSSQSQTYLCSVEGSVSRRLMSLNWHAVFWVTAELGLKAGMGVSLLHRLCSTPMVWLACLCLYSWDLLLWGPQKWSVNKIPDSRIC